MGIILKYKKHILLACVFVFTWSISFYFSTRLLMRETDEIVVPKVIGLPIVEVEKMFKLRKLDLKVEKYEETSEFPENMVLSQSVEPGTIVKEHRTIFINVSKKQGGVEIPDLSGKDLVEAKKMISRESLKITSISYACNKKVKREKILSQNPLPDDLAKDRNIQLLVSAGPCENLFLVDNMAGRKIDEQIKKDFSGKEINLKQISKSDSRENINKLKVISQDPVAGSIVKSGDNVILNME